MFIVLIASNAFSQSISITGVITDDTKMPLPGVTVMVKNTAIGVVTNNNGKYTINAPSSESVLIFSFIGFESIEKKVGNQKVINIVLLPATQDIDEVVVVGYGTQRKGDVSSAIGGVNMKDFSAARVPTFDQALAGRVAGVSAISSDGQPGSVSNIVIRGASSLTQDNSPLYVIDGFPDESSNAASINPSDIESITVLKDASATAIYGSRGSNGVIIITTKRGKEGAPVITYNGSYGFQNATKTQEVLSPYEYVKLQMEINPITAGLTYLNGRSIDYYRNVDPISWEDGVYRTGVYQNHDISMRGGNTTTQYSVSGSYLDQKGVFINSGFTRYQGRFSIDNKLSDKIKVGITGNYSRSSDLGTIVANSASWIGSTGILYNVWGQRPLNVNAADDIASQLIDPTINPANDYRINPILDLANTYRRTTKENGTFNGYLMYNITKDLSLRINGGVNLYEQEGEQFYNSLTRSGNPNSPWQAGVNGSISFIKTKNWSNENILTYSKKINEKHNLNIIAGYTVQKNNYSSYGYAANKLPNESEGMSGLDESGLVTSLTAQISEWSLVSYLSRISYNYGGKYYFSASARADKSSKFPINQTGYFPSGSVAWRFTQENFIKKFEWLSDGKLRAGYGVTGNNRVSDFAGLNQLTFPINPAYSYNNESPTPIAVPSAFGNPNLKWESTATFNVGMDLSFFKSRVNLVVDIYRKRTYDLLLNAPLPPTTGYSSAFKNIGKVQNQGLEFTLNTVNIDKNNFKWNSNFNISFNRSKVLALTDNTESMMSTLGFSSGFGTGSGYIAKMGQPIAQMYGYVWEGNYQYSDFDQIATSSSGSTYLLKNTVPYYGTQSSIKPGMIKYKDLNGDGQITSDDQTIIGRATPLFEGGLNNDFSYKGFDMSVFIQFSYGGDILNGNRLAFEAPGTNYGQNQFATVANRWSPTNQNNKIPVVSNSSFYGVYSSRVIEDGSFARLKTISFGYTLPKSILGKMKISSLRIYTTAQNLFVLTNYSGPDPEVSVRNSALTPSFDYSPYPIAKQIVFGINATF